MFQRQGFGSVNPFQVWGGGINPFFQSAVGANPFLQFTGGVNPLQQIAGLINPLYQLASVSPYQQIAGSPFQQITGTSPFQQFAGASPFQQIPGAAYFNPVGGALNPSVHQMVGAQPLGVTPGLGVPPIAGLGLNPLAGHYGYGVGPTNPFVGQIGTLGAINPGVADPTIALLLAHQFNPVTQHLPIRPLAGQNPLEQFQGMTGNPLIGLPMDPYAALINAQIFSQLSANPLLQVSRGHYGNPYPWLMGQGPVTTPPTPFGI